MTPRSCRIARARTSIGEAELPKVRVARTFYEEVVSEVREIQTKVCNLRTTLELNGAVFTALSDGLADSAGDEPYYLIGVRIAEEGLDKLGYLALVPSVPTEVFITTGERIAMSP